jgi:hypothetical protein
VWQDNGKESETRLMCLALDILSWKCLKPMSRKREYGIYICSTEYCYSTIKKNNIMLFAGKSMDLEIIMLSKISQSGKDKYHMFSLVCGI